MIFKLDKAYEREDIKGTREVKRENVNELDVLMRLKVYWSKRYIWGG